MIGASKILTVSYGTFSCTLEGFDEPFNTMKAIAEYFRDLAAEDRYFGAEPPTPDAAMLHRIAEREIQRRVEAKIQDNGVILRTGEAMDAVALSGPVLQPALADATVAADSVAARLSKLRGTAAPFVAETVAAPVVPAAFDIAEAAPQSYREDQDAEDLIADLGIATDMVDQPADLDALMIAAIDSETAYDAAPVAAHAELAIAEQDWQAPEADLGALDFDDLVPVDENTEQHDAFDDYDALTAAAEAESVAELARFDAQLIENVDQQSVDDQALEDQASDDAMLASLGTLIDPDDQEYLDDDQDASADFGQLVPSQPPQAPAARFDAPKFDAEADVAIAAELARLAAATARAATAGDETAEPGRLQRARARVIKIRRADAPPIDADLPRANLTADEVISPASGLLSPEAEAALQAELAALEAEAEPAPTAAPAAEPLDEDTISTGQTAQPADPVAPEGLRPTRPTRPVRSIAVTAPTGDASQPQVLNMIARPVTEPRKRIEADGADEAVNRLIAQTNTAMDGPETKRRQSAIAHLKAAVVATEADRQMAPSQPKPDRIDPYRHDLESVVRPRRLDQSNADRPSPLVLVSEQRIDRKPAIAAEAPRAVSPVRPRRIAATSALALHTSDTIFGGQDDDLEDEAEFVAEAAAAGNLFSDTESFGDFAERLGAVQLPDMLEAAAVYCAQVLGRPQFSRPMVLGQLATLPEAAEYSREDGLRVFGTLMRQGRIAKIKHGQFAVTDRSPLLAEALRSVG